MKQMLNKFVMTYHIVDIYEIYIEITVDLGLYIFIYINMLRNMIQCGIIIMKKWMKKISLL